MPREFQWVFGEAKPTGGMMSKFIEQYRSMTISELMHERAAIEEELRQRNPSIYRTESSSDETKGDVINHDPDKKP